jgi:hypothetical protein
VTAAGAKPAEFPIEAAHQVRVRDQPEDGQGPRPHDPAGGAGEGGRSPSLDSMLSGLSLVPAHQHPDHLRRPIMESGTRPRPRRC